MDRVLAALGVERAALPVELYDVGMRFVVVALDSAAALAALEPDMSSLGRLVDRLEDRLVRLVRARWARVPAAARGTDSVGHRAHPSDWYEALPMALTTVTRTQVANRALKDGTVQPRGVELAVGHHVGDGHGTRVRQRL